MISMQQTIASPCTLLLNKLGATSTEFLTYLRDYASHLCGNRWVKFNHLELLVLPIEESK